MPLRKNYRKKKSTKPRRRRIYRKKRMGANGVPEWASMSCTRSLINPAPIPGFPDTMFAPNVPYRYYDVALDQFPRAVPLCSAYQMYRIKRVTMTFRPLVDTFTAGGASSVPNLYYQIDKNRSLNPLAGLASLKAMGCVARRLDDKAIRVSWAPGVLDAGTDDNVGNFTFAKFNVSPWLNTTDNPFDVPAVVSSVDHTGITWCVEQVIGGNASYTIDVVVDFQFKKPLAEPAEGQARALNVA